MKNEKAGVIKLLILDVDGILTSGQLFYNENGQQTKSFNVKDGLGIQLLIKNNINVAIITGMKSKIVLNRAHDLGINHIFQNQMDKSVALKKLLNYLNLTSKQVACMGDDLPDLTLFSKVGLSIAVNDAHPFIKKYAKWITKKDGGKGAVREVCDNLLRIQGKLEKIYNKYL